MPGLEQAAADKLKSPPIHLSQPQAELLLQQLRETADFRQWQLLAVAIMFNHFHLVVARRPKDGCRREGFYRDVNRCARFEPSRASQCKCDVFDSAAVSLPFKIRADEIHGTVEIHTVDLDLNPIAIAHLADPASPS